MPIMPMPFNSPFGMPPMSPIPLSSTPGTIPPGLPLVANQFNQQQLIDHSSDDDDAFDTSPIFNRDYLYISVKGKQYPLDSVASKNSSKLLDEEIKERDNFINSLEKCTRLPYFVSLIENQTPVKDQLGRPTSTAFAVISAMEAAYAREQGGHFDLSEQFAHFIGQSSIYNPTDINDPDQLENHSSMWGNSNVHSMLLAMKNYGVPSERVCPYKSQDEMIKLRNKLSPELKYHPFEHRTQPSRQLTQHDIDRMEYSSKYIPDTVRSQLSFGVDHFIKLTKKEATSPCIIKQFIHRRLEVIIDFELKWKRGKNDIMISDHSHRHKHSNHTKLSKIDNYGAQTLIIIGYNSKVKYFTCKTSWEGLPYVKISFNFLKNSAISGGVILNVSRPFGEQTKERTLRASFLGKWHTDLDGGRAMTVIRRVAPQIHLGHFYPLSGPMSQNGVVLKGNWTKHNRLLQLLIGRQVYSIYSHRHDQNYLSGTATFKPPKAKHSVMFGCILSHLPLPPPSEPESKLLQSRWLHGMWRITIDGLGSQILNVTNESDHDAKPLPRGLPIMASFTYQSGRSSPATVYYDETGEIPHSAYVVVKGIYTEKPMAMALLRHNLEVNILSGLTHNSHGEVVSVVGFKDFII